MSKRINISDSSASKLEQNQKAIAAYIKQGRIRKGWTQKELANALNVSDKNVSKWESGNCNYTIQTLMKVFTVLDLQLSFVVED